MKLNGKVLEEEILEEVNKLKEVWVIFLCFFLRM